MGLLIGGAVFPTAFAITWKGQTRAGAISGCLSGLAAGLIAWLTTAKQYYGVINVTTTGNEYPTLAGNLAAVMTGLIVSVCVSLIKPANFDWEITRAINALPVMTEGTKPNPTATSSPSTPELSSVEDKKAIEADEPLPQPETNTNSIVNEEKALHIEVETEDDPRKLRGAFKLACIASFVLTFILDFLIPMPMFFSHYIFSKGFFTGWVVISFIWVFSSAFISCFLPIWETRSFFVELWRAIAKDVGRGRGK
jgi:urea-proton symporter